MGNQIVGVINIPWDNKWKGFVRNKNNYKLTQAASNYVLKNVCGYTDTKSSEASSYFKNFRKDNPDIIGQRAKKQGIIVKVRECLKEKEVITVQGTKTQPKKCPVSGKRYKVIREAANMPVSDLANNLLRTGRHRHNKDAFVLLFRKISSTSQAVDLKTSLSEAEKAIKQLKTEAKGLRIKLKAYYDRLRNPQPKVPIIE